MKNVKGRHFQFSYLRWAHANIINFSALAAWSSGFVSAWSLRVVSSNPVRENVGGCFLKMYRRSLKSLYTAKVEAQA
jgi:hypothetical protein